MTTVVFDGTSIACDSRRTAEGVIDPFDTGPKFIATKNAVFAGCGATLWFPAFVDWWGSKSDYPLDDSVRETGGAEVAVFHRNAWRSYFADTPHPQKLGSRWAIGTGSKFALAAMLCGKNAAEAVAIAIQLDAFSGGAIFHVELRELIARGTEAVKEYRNGAHTERKPNRTSVALHAREGAKGAGIVRGGRQKPARVRDALRG